MKRTQILIGSALFTFGAQLPAALFLRRSTRAEH